jgi:antitoxin component of MazEF toxin-antitoxin module
MGYPTKIQLIARERGNQWYVNFPNALAEAMNFKKSETVEWEVESLAVLRMVRKSNRSHKPPQKTNRKKQA